MPELPEVTGYKRYVDATALHQRIQAVTVLDDRIVRSISARQLCRRLKGSALEQTVRHGKLLFARLSRGGWLILHFGMTGSLRYFSRTTPIPRHTKLLLIMDGGCLGFRCSRMFGWAGFAKNVEDVLKARKVGPDALSKGLTMARFLSILAGRRGALKPVLLNQSLVAGIGNIWADEILFQMPLHPGTPVDALGRRERQHLYRTMRRVLSLAARTGGNTGRLPRRYLVHQRGRHGRCPSCRQALSSATIGGRTAWFCARCQKGRERSRGQG